MSPKVTQGIVEELLPLVVLQKTTASKDRWMGLLKPRTIALITVTTSHQNTPIIMSVPNRC